MDHSIAALAQALNLPSAGDTSLTVTRAAEPGDAGPGDLALAMSPRYAEALGQGAARAAILWDGADWEALGLKAAIFAPRPRLAMAGLTARLDRGQGFGPGIHPSAVIDPSAVIGADVSIGPLAVIAAGARIGDGTVLGPQVYVGADAQIGPGGYVREAVSIGARVVIGARVFIQPGARIGADGFSFVTPEVSGVEKVRETLADQGDTQAQSWIRIHSLGAVRIGDDVEIGAGCTFDNGTIRDTVIGDRTKFDNQVHLGHNVKIGTDCLICGQTGLSGSVVMGNNVVLGGQCGVADNTFVGDNVVAGGATKIVSNAPAGRVLMGYPAVKMDLHTEIYKAQRRLPRLLRDVAELKKAVFNKEPNG
ncbi:UDP-3-O-(3-hydroxymyristoyl)glucosamine N-acyltransferase [Chachezhania antarctica]|uniref:UDP-3-O-(3-hydroxymyristoyl)glucosamine N-acyltransferase n=1 Tax=Chachezhania antarctica TaxID=2340860 RepID=UPI000EABFB7E|nr:UDP-3-O-(3-hydroxymyristoyl)glucosamine N-acyltransferase [Chachezhania antarctica]|tara:strand:+ start:7551 stop:8642 length:1092 start_codon:yes stop_codon:yes gene_type:complete